MRIVRVRRFGGSREANPPGWGVLLNTEKVYLFAGVADYLIGDWWIDYRDQGAWWPVASEDEMPDDVCAALAKWRLTNDTSS